MASQKIRIKLKSYDHTLVDLSAEKIVETAAKIITVTIAIQYLPRYLISFFVEPLKSFGFSAIIPAPRPIGPLGLLEGILVCFILFSLILNALLFIYFFCCIVNSQFLS